jgi:hypothetical protein
MMVSLSPYYSHLHQSPRFHHMMLLFVHHSLIPSPRWRISSTPHDNKSQSLPSIPTILFSLFYPQDSSSPAIIHD